MTSIEQQRVSPPEVGAPTPSQAVAPTQPVESSTVESGPDRATPAGPVPGPAANSAPTDLPVVGAPTAVGTTASGSDPADPDPTPDEPAEEAPTPERVAASATQDLVKELLVAYQVTMDRVEALPPVVWIPWDEKGPGRYVKVPYVRLFLRFFMSHHINRNLAVVNRRLQSRAALADEPDATKSSREMVRYFQQSLPAPPYRTLIFAVIAAALVVALPLQAFGNVFYVLDLVGALLRLDVGYAGRAFASKELGPTLRSLLVLLMGLIVVSGVLTSPFGLKRALLNLYPWTDEDVDRTAARSHGHRIDGIYALETRVFADVGGRQPREGRWDLGFQTALLVCLVVLELMLVLITVALAFQIPLLVDIDLGIDGPDMNVELPVVPWWYFGAITGLVFVACILLIWRLGDAWKVRRRS